MITEHTDTTTTTPPEGARQQYLGDQSRTLPHTPTPPPKGQRGKHTGVLKMLASTIQFSNNNPHTPHNRWGPVEDSLREPSTHHHR